MGLRSTPPKSEHYYQSWVFPLDLGFLVSSGFLGFLQEIWVYFAKSQWQH